MKKSLIASAACLACTGVWAQVNLYGIVDAGVTHVTGLTGGSKTQLSSGIMEGSRWGIRVQEDLGGGFKAMATMESRVEVNDGSLSNRPASGSQLPDRLTAGLPPSVAAGVSGAVGPTLGVNLDSRGFDRQAWVGLVTPVGGFLMGRQYTPAFEALATFDIMGTQSALSAGQLVTIPAGVDIRYDNTLQYRIVTGPWNASLMTSFPGGATSSSKRLMGLNAIYKGNAFQAGFGHNTKKNSADQKSLSTTAFGASSTMGAFTVSGMYARIQEPNPSSGPELAAGFTAAGVPAALVSNVIDRLKQDGNLLHMGVRYQMGAAGQVTFAVTKYNDKRATNADVTTYGVAYTYPLSKRTNLNMVVTRYNNSANAQTAPGGNGYLGGVTAVAGQDSTSVAFGIRHTF
jgi:predicted porin